jgi:MFS family permease
LERGVKIALALCFVILFASFGIRNSYGILLPEMITQLRMSKTGSGMVMSSYFLAYMTFTPILGSLADRLEFHILLIPFLLLLGTSSVLVSYANSPLQAGIFFGLAGIGASACWVPVMSFGQRLAALNRKGRTLALIDTASPVSAVFVSISVPLIMVKFHWELVWRLWGTLTILLVFAVLVLQRTWFRKIPPRVVSKRVFFSAQHLGEIFKDGIFWRIGVTYMLFSFAVYVPCTFLTAYGVLELAFSFDLAARLVTVMAIGSILGKIVLATLSDTFGRSNLVVTCALLIALGNLGISSVSNPVSLIIFVFAFGIGMGAIYPLYAAFASDYFPPDRVGTILGIWTVFYGIGAVISPALSGLLSDYIGTLAWSFRFAGLSSVAALLAVLSLGIRR